MNIAELLERKIVFVAGKGGVGKSTIAATLALIAARRGTTVCIVESDGQEQAARLFQARPSLTERISIAPHIHAISLTLEGALKQFLARRLPLHAISGRLINNRLVRYFLDATPGLKELLILGAIADLAIAARDDLIIVDLPATGHGLAMLSVPDVVIKAVHAGPLKHHAEKIRTALSDPATSALCFVSLAEELSVQETIELKDAIATRLPVTCGPIIVNAVLARPFDPRERNAYAALKRRWAKDAELAPLIEGAELALARAVMNEYYVARLAEAFSTAPVVLPFLFSEAIDRDAIAYLADCLSEGGGT